MTVTCSKCGEEWPRDPALEVECPTCHAPPGEMQAAIRPSLRVTPSRDQAAMDAGFLRPCPKGPSAQQAMAPQLELF